MADRGRVAWATLASASVAVLALSGMPAAAGETRPCSYGHARSWFETFPYTFDGAPPPCTFRLFFDGRTVALAEGDWFLGGLVRREAFSDDASRDAAIAKLEAVRVRVWIAESTAAGVGPLIEHAVERTAIKTYGDSASGQEVWAQWAIIDRLPPGEYLVVTEHPGFPGGRTRSTVRLQITETG